MSGVRRDVLVLSLTCALALLAYSNAFHGEFQYDDDRIIRFNFSLRNLSDWRHITAFEAFRPLPLLTYALNFKIGRKDPFTYHVFDFVLHLISTILFYIFLRRISSDRLLCFFSAALFAVHPLNTESVSYTASRPILLCAVFYWTALLSFDWHLQNPRWYKAVLFFTFFLLGLLSKEESALIPFAALVYNFVFFGAESVRKHRIFHGATILLVFGGTLFRLSFISNLPHPVSVYIPTEVFVWFRYLALACFPVPLNVDHYVEPLDWLHWKFLASVAGIFALGYLLWRVRKSHSFVLFWSAWFFFNLSASSFVPLNDFMAEHRTYLSLFGFCAILGYLVTLRKEKSILIPAALTCLLIFFMIGTWKRNQVWQERVLLWVDAVQKSPQKFRPHVNLAFVFYQLGLYDAALQEYTIARSLNPALPIVHSGRGFALLELGQIEEAEQSFRLALRIDTNHIDAKTGLGMIQYRQKRYREALSYFEITYPHRRESPELVAMMCDSYLKISDPTSALKILSEASSWDPRFDLIKRLLQSGRHNDASRQLHRILQQS